MADTATIDYDSLRERFPWAGLADEDDLPPASRFREVMERAHVDRAAVDALDAARRTA